MDRKGIALSAVIALGLAAAPLAGAEAHRHHHGFPLFLPFVAAGAIVGTAASIATAPFAAVAAPSPYYYGAPAPSYYPPSPAYYAPGSQPGYYQPEYYQPEYYQPGYYQPGYNAPYYGAQ